MSGRVTLPIEQGMDDQLPGILASLGADAVRNSDGTWLPEITSELGVKVYSTYFPARGDQEFALQHLDARPHFYLMSNRVTALNEQPLAINVMDGYYELQVAPDTDDVRRYWEVIDRTSGEVVSTTGWRLEGENVVVIADPIPFHVYTVNFLAWHVWDSTQMYNYLTNNWWDDPSRVREIGYDARNPVVWEHMKSSLKKWCDEHPEVDVVRFTTFFYHFTLVFNDAAKEKFVDWFGYSASVSPAALEAFAAEYGYQLTPEDFVDEGYYNSPFRTPSAAFRDWIQFQTEFVTSRVTQLVKIVHDAGKEAMMFLGDNWIGTEPYGDLFEKIGMDAVVGSVGSAATCRMISDIPGVKYSEGRFLPYFFPDVFRPGGDPLSEANESWLTARRAIVRHPLDRIGYGGYLSLATQFPDFMSRISEICDEFRSIHDRSESKLPANSRLKVAILNDWGAQRTWQTHMVAHALWYRQIYSYLGVIESLAGLPFDVSFISFDDVLAGSLAKFQVVINAGAAETAFSGGKRWLEEDVITKVREFVAGGGGLIGVGQPSAIQANGAYLQLSDVFGLDQERGYSLSTDRYHEAATSHFITADLDSAMDIGEHPGDMVQISPDLQILQLQDDCIQIGVHEFGQGRAVYLAGLPYSPENCRVLQRAIYYAAGAEDLFAKEWTSSNLHTEVAYYPHTNCVFVYNNSYESVQTEVSGTLANGDKFTQEVQLAPMASQWLSV